VRDEGSAPVPERAPSSAASRALAAHLPPAASPAAALILIACAAIWASSASTQVGFAWAENDYLDHMDRILEWSTRIREMGLRRGIAVLTGPYWEAKCFWNPHPPLFKYAGLLGLQRRVYLRGDLGVARHGAGPYYFVVNRHDNEGGRVARVESEGKLLSGYGEDGVLLVGLFHLPGGVLPAEKKP